MGYKPNLFPKREGNTSRSAHRNLPEGTVELEHGRAGFAGPVSHLYKTHAPTVDSNRGAATPPFL